jgi:phospholipid/cholesterol/gamma-HCH transport system ATP-binding protein
MSRMWAATIGLTRFACRTLRELRRLPWDGAEISVQLYEIGWRSAPLILIAGVVLGIVMTQFVWASLVNFGAVDAVLPAELSRTMFRQVGPLMAGLLIAGRVGSAIGAELAVLRLTEQIDAFESLAIDSFRHLVITRVAACVIALPILTLLMCFAEIAGGFLWEATHSEMSLSLYVGARIRQDRMERLHSADADDRRRRIRDRYRRLLFRLFGRRECRRSAARLDAQCRALLPFRDCAEPHGQPDDVLLVSDRHAMNLDRSVAVRFDRVSKSIDEARVLEDVSFEISRGTAFSILGRRGAGKTMLLKLAIGLLKPDRGRIFVNGEDITALDTPDLLRVRRSTGFVFQNSAAFDSICVAENVAFPLRYHSDKPESEIQDKVRELLIQADLEQDRYTMPVDLSVGMRKLLGFARALACDPALLVIDDPWNGVDSITVNRICRLLLDLKRRRGTTLLIAANKVPDVQRLCDQLAILDGGHLITCGPPDELARCGNPLASEFASP